MEVRLLGAVGIWRAGHQVALPRPHRRLILAALAMVPGEPVSKEALIDRVWGDQPPRAALHSLYAHVSALRRLLAEVCGESGDAAVRRSASGYVLQIDPQRVDLHRARRYATEARQLAGGGGEQGQRAAKLLREAHALWQGEALAGLTGAWATRVRAGLESERVAVVVDRFEAELQLGNHAAAVGPLATILADHPLIEPLVGLQMRALYRCCRAPEALALYARTRRQLVDELGDEPGTELRQLHKQILHRDRALDAAPAVGPIGKPPAQLPPDVTAFTGRVADLARLDSVLGRRVATPPAAAVGAAITGTAGVGKTTLAVHWAHRVADRFPDGQLFFDLHGYAHGTAPVTPDDALGRMLRALGVPDARIPADLDDRAGLWRTVLAGRRMLIVLDNAANDSQVVPLLPGALGCLVLVTSRRRLSSLDFAGTVSLDTMPLADAVDLFAATAGTDRLGDQPDELVTQAVHLCDRLPLAIRIAAARLRSRPAWSMADLLERLRDREQRLAELADGRRGVATALDLSYRQLTAEQRRFYRLVGTHPGPHLDPYTAAALAGTTLAPARRLLDRLLDAHLLQEPTAGRYVFHDLVRAHAIGAAAADEPPSERRAALARLLDHYRGATSTAVYAAYSYDREYYPQVPPDAGPDPELPDPAQALDWLDRELPSLLAVAHRAADEGWHEYTMDLSAILGSHLDTRSRLHDAETLHHSALQAARATRDLARERDALTRLGLLHLRQGRHGRAIDDYAHALALACRTGDPAGGFDALKGLGEARRRQGRYRQAIDHYTQLRELARAGGSPTHERMALTGLGLVDLQQGRHDRALHRFRRALEIARSTGNPGDELAALMAIGMLHWQQGRDEDGLGCHQEVLKISQAIGDRKFEWEARSLIADIHRRRGRYELAGEGYRWALAIARDAGSRNGQFEALHGLGRLHHTTGSHETARSHHDQALELATALRQPADQARAHDGLAHAHLAAGRPEQARHHWRQALAILTRIGTDTTEEPGTSAAAMRAHLAVLDPV